MKIAILADGIPPMVMGGMQKHSFYLAKYLALEGIHVELHTMIWREEDSDRDPPFSEVEMQFIKVVTHRFPSSIWFPGHYVVNSFRLSRLFYSAIESRLEEFDFVYTKGFTGWQLLRKRGRRLPHRVGVKFHGMNMFLPTYGCKQKLEQLFLRPPVKWIMKRADVVFSYGGKVTQTITQAGVERNKIVEIPTGIESRWIRRRIKTTRSTRKVVFVGRYDPVKGIRELNNVLSKIVFERLEFDFVGPFEESKRLESHHINYLGVIQDEERMKEVLDNADALILPSYSEGMPNVILEAMARGLVILGSDVGAIAMMVDNNGWLLDHVSEDSIHEILAKFENASDGAVDGMKRRSLEKVSQEYLWNTISKRLFRNMESLTNQQRGHV